MPTDADRGRGPARPGDGAARRFRKLPVEIEAVQYTGASSSERDVELWAGQTFGTQSQAGVVCLVISTLEGAMLASPGDWIIRGVRSELYPCKADIFAATYEPADPAPPAAPGAAADYVLPCDVRLPPATKIARGCTLSALLTALSQREGLADEHTRFAAAAPASALPGAEAVAEALWEAEGTSTWGDWLAYVANNLSLQYTVDRTRKRAAAVLAHLARSDAPAGPGLAGAVRAVLDHAGDLRPGASTSVPDALLAKLRDAALDGGAGGGSALDAGLREALRLIGSRQWPKGKTLVETGQGVSAEDAYDTGVSDTVGVITALIEGAYSAPPRSGQRGGNDAQG